jgi:DNA adenine methylase
MQVYASIRTDPDAFHVALSRLPTGEEHYYRIRSQDPAQLSQFKRSVRFVYLNRYCFNGIFRTNMDGLFNVPFGGAQKENIPSVVAFRKCAQLLQHAHLRAGDFGHVLRDCREGDFVYLDPPYAVESRRVFRQYNPRSFSRDDLKRLGQHLIRLQDRGVNFAVSYADCSEARQILRRWNMRRVRVRRNVAGFVGSRRIAFELLATNVEN